MIFRSLADTIATKPRPTKREMEGAVGRGEGRGKWGGVENYQIGDTGVAKGCGVYGRGEKKEGQRGRGMVRIEEEG